MRGRIGKSGGHYGEGMSKERDSVGGGSEVEILYSVWIPSPCLGNSKQGESSCRIPRCFYYEKPPLYINLHLHQASMYGGRLVL